MTRKMIINAIDPEEVRIAILKDRTLEDFDIETRGVEKNKGNIYKGVVMAVEPALNAAFVNYGADKQGFLTANDVHPKYAHNPSNSSDKNPQIADLLKPKQTVLVQVSKDEVSTKGAVLTTYLSLAGRYLVLMPDSETQGISRKIEDEETRRRVREAAAKLNVPDNMGVIIRTAGRDRTRVELNRDLKVLLRLWNNIQKETAQAKAPALIFKEQDVIIRALRDYFSSDIDEIVLDSDEAYDRASEYMHLVMPNQLSALTRYVERRPIFHHYQIEEQLDSIYVPKVVLPSGGSIIIESPEALVAIDVNSGKQKSPNQEETATQTNMEAAREIARQLRLRDLGGIIVIDFIDMVQRKNQQKIERTLKEALRFDKARIKVGRISRNGTLEITRQRLRSALQTSVFEACSVCNGTGYILNSSSHTNALIRKLQDRASRGDLKTAQVRVAPEVANLLKTQYWSKLQSIERGFEVRVDIQADPSFHSGQTDFTFTTDPDAVITPLEEPNFGPAPRPEDFGEAPATAEDEDYDEEEAKLHALDAEDERLKNLAEAEDPEEGQDDEIHASARRQLARSVRGRRGRGKSTRTRTSLTDAVPTTPHDALEMEDTTLNLPTYEFIDLQNVASHRGGQRTAGRGTRRQAPETGSNKRNKRSANVGRGRSGQRYESISAAEALRGAKKTPNTGTSPESKRGILSRLIGWATGKN